MYVHTYYLYTHTCIYTYIYILYIQTYICACACVRVRVEAPIHDIIVLKFPIHNIAESGFDNINGHPIPIPII